MATQHHRPHSASQAARVSDPVAPSLLLSARPTTQPIRPTQETRPGRVCARPRPRDGPHGQGTGAAGEAGFLATEERAAGARHRRSFGAFAVGCRKMNAELFRASRCRFSNVQLQEKKLRILVIPPATTRSRVISKASSCIVVVVEQSTILLSCFRHDRFSPLVVDTCSDDSTATTTGIVHTRETRHMYPRISSSDVTLSP